MDTHQVFKLSPSLLYDRILSAQNDAHATQVPDLRAANDQGVDVEPASSKNARHAREHSGLVVHKTVEHMSVHVPLSTYELTDMRDS